MNDMSKQEETFDFDTQCAVPLSSLFFPLDEHEIDDDAVSLTLSAGDHRLLVSAMRSLHRRMIRQGDARVVPAAALLENLETATSPSEVRRPRIGHNGETSRPPFAA